ncbi:putative polygalacturonase [Medicago truncatula]|uniref:Polygalacturonase n=1 Tax=Medicago truncatula TaxID=3880 RepID=G7K092_MEDTR|nr:polygalacturonase At1g48100 [Medicago truncatula]AES96173.2 polygalacturonase [Medicago truncatula]RHN55040.1 putative polygalacturonase [Medicago truncatula]
MSGFSLRGFTYMLLIAFLIWSSNFECCIARRGKHLRQSRTFSSSLFKKKGKSYNGNSHNKNHHSGGSNSKPKSPPHKSTPPLPKSPPSHKSVPSSPPISKPKYSPSIPPPKANNGVHSTFFNVLDYGAKGDGNTDDTKAFQATWAATCKVEASTMVIPANYIFYVGPISFSGPYCKANIVFQLDGTIIAPTNPNAWSGVTLQWLEFTKLEGITIQGNGVIDGRGSVWWQDFPYDNPIDDEEKLIVPLNQTQKPPMPVQNEMGRKMPSNKPTALRFYGSYGPTVTGITIQNSPQCHLKFDNCNGVLVHDVSISSPGDSPNTDGIHLQNSKDVLIHSSKLACGDDCISIQTGCSNVYVHNVNCGPGHGISIGSLGKDNTRACVSNITVRDVNIHDSMNGVRIKTWQGGSGSVQGVLFSNIQVSEVQLPIVIDQFYCDKRVCTNHTSAVSLAGINYERIKGTYTVKPVHFACSDSLPCVDVSLTTVELKPIQEKYHLYDPFCWQTFGELRTPTVPPIGCLQIGKPSNNRIQTDHDIC